MIDDMKKILLFALPLLAMCFASCEKEWTDDSPIIQFKDPKFLESLIAQGIHHVQTGEFERTIDKNADGQISEKEASVATDLFVSSNGIRNLDEIRYFTSLTSLNCSGNQLTSLDVSNNTALTELDCNGNQLTSLDVSKNTALTELWCDNNQLTSLDVSKNTALTELWCDNNQLTSLDLSKNTALTELWCKDNQLTSLDVSNNTALTELSCSENQLTSLDLSNNTALTDLTCSSNPLTKLILNIYHMILDYRMSAITEEYGDIIEYAE